MTRTRLFFAICAGFSFFALIASAQEAASDTAAKASDAVDVASRLELFVDDYIAGSFDGTALRLHEPEDQGPVLLFDQPWEGPHCAYVTVFFDGTKYRMYYRGGPTPGKGDSSDEQTCYAESDNGIDWKKPNLGFYEWNGIKENNIIYDDDANISHNFAPFYDTNPNAPPEEKYKALGGSEKVGLVAFVSADGVHWKKMQDGPVAQHKNYACDSQNVSFWSEFEGKYLCYLRVWDGYWSGFRTVGRLESDDFRSWGPEGALFMTYGDTQREHLYTNQTTPYFRAPHIYLATAARFMPEKRVITPEEAAACEVLKGYDGDCSDSVLMSTRGGNVYARTFMEGLIRPGTDPGDWVSRTNYPACGIVQTGPEEMSMYAQKFYSQPRAALHRYTWTLDRIVSVNAPYAGGEFKTKPLVFSGADLYINANTSAPGSIQIELLDENGTPIPGFELDKSPVLTGNWIEKKVVWADGKSVAELASKPVILRFVMKDADLYSIRFK